MRDWSRFVGIPFVDGGRDFSGCDCYGLVRLGLMTGYGVTWPLLSGEYSDASDHDRVGAVIKLWQPLLAGARLHAPEEAAVVVVNISGYPAHIGLCVSNDLILHAWTRTTASVLQRTDHPFFKGRIGGYYRVR